MRSSLPNRYINKIRSEPKRINYINIIYIRDGKKHKISTNVKSDNFDPFLYMKGSNDSSLIELNIPSISLSSKSSSSPIQLKKVQSTPSSSSREEGKSNSDGIKLLKQVNMFITTMKMGQSLESLIKPENKNEIIDIKDKKIIKKE